MHVELLGDARGAAAGGQEREHGVAQALGRLGRRRERPELPGDERPRPRQVAGQQRHQLDRRVARHRRTAPPASDAMRAAWSASACELRKPAIALARRAERDEHARRRLVALECVGRRRRRTIPTTTSKRAAPDGTTSGSPGTERGRGLVDRPLEPAHLASRALAIRSATWWRRSSYPSRRDATSSSTGSPARIARTVSARSCAALRIMRSRSVPNSSTSTSETLST